MPSNNKNLHELPVLGSLPLDWEIKKFGDILNGGTRNGVYKTKEFHGRGSKVVNMGELFKYPRLKNVPMKRIELSDSELQKSSLKEGDLLFARRSLVAEGAGKCSIVKEVTESTVFESSIIRARPNQKIIDPDFLYYLFSSAYGVYILGTIRRQVAVAGITGSDLITLPIPVPPLNYQIGVAKLLSYFDDKIHTNQLINLKLEKITQTMFKSWFIDFDPVHAKKLALEKGLSKEQSERAAMAIISGICSLSDFAENFEEMNQRLTQKLSKMSKEHQKELAHTASLFPSEFEDSELGEIPKRWSVSKIGNIVRRLSSKTKYTKKNVSVCGKTIVLEQGASLILGYTDSEGDFLCSPEAPKFIFGDHTCIMKLCGRNFSISANVIPLEGKDFPTAWVYYACLNRQNFEEYRRHWAEFIIKEVILPSKELSILFSKIQSNILSKTEAVSMENNLLEDLRDTLLPKLLSGEIDLSNIKLNEDLGSV